jgi:hypothetical protein
MKQGGMAADLWTEMQLAFTFRAKVNASDKSITMTAEDETVESEEVAQFCPSTKLLKAS